MHKKRRRFNIFDTRVYFLQFLCPYVGDDFTLYLFSA